jgi:hypothetical protein
VCCGAPGPAPPGPLATSRDAIGNASSDRHSCSTVQSVSTQAPQIDPTPPRNGVVSIRLDRPDARSGGYSSRQEGKQSFLSLCNVGETVSIAKSLILRARTETARDVRVQHGRRPAADEAVAGHEDQGGVAELGSVARERAARRVRVAGCLTETGRAGQAPQVHREAQGADLGRGRCVRAPRRARLAAPRRAAVYTTYLTLGLKQRWGGTERSIGERNGFACVMTAREHSLKGPSRPECRESRSLSPSFRSTAATCRSDNLLTISAGSMRLTEDDEGCCHSMPLIDRKIWSDRLWRLSQLVLDRPLDAPAHVL